MKRGSGIDEGQDAVACSVISAVTGYGLSTLQRRAVAAVGLAEDVVLLPEAAIIVERRAPEHLAAVHHAVGDVLEAVLVAQAARLFGHAQVARD